jgi:hypothetical protein
MHHEIVSRGWMESKAFMDGVALGQITPGTISLPKYGSTPTSSRKEGPKVGI